MRRLTLALLVLLAPAAAWAQVYQTGDDLPFAAHFVASKVGATGLTVTVDCDRAGTSVVTGASATEERDGYYSYTLDGSHVTTAGHYVCIFKTADSSVDQQHIADAIRIAPANANLDASIQTADTAIDGVASAIGTPSNLGSGATVAANLADIEGQTDDIGSLPTAAAIADAVSEEATADHSGVSGSNAEAWARVDATVSSRSDFDETADPVQINATGGSAGEDADDLVAAVQSGLSTFDPSTDPVELRASGGTAGTNAPELVTLNWAALTADNDAAGSMGEALSAAGGASDPLLNDVPGSYSPGTGGYALGRVGVAAIDVTSPVDVHGNLSIFQGADSTVDFDNADGTWSDLTGATVTMYIDGAVEADGSTYSLAGTVVTPTGSQKVRFAIPDTDADTLAAGDYNLQIWAVLSGGAEEVLSSGVASITGDAR